MITKIVRLPMRLTSARGCSSRFSCSCFANFVTSSDIPISFAHQHFSGPDRHRLRPIPIRPEVKRRKQLDFGIDDTFVSVARKKLLLIYGQFSEQAESGEALRCRQGDTAVDTKV